MADNTREQERSELYKGIWKMACDFVHGGSVSPNDFKQYVFGTMFYRFLSESLDTFVSQEEINGGAEADFRYANLSDEEAEGARDDLLNVKGFFIKPSELFCNVQKKAQEDEDANRFSVQAIVSQSIPYRLCIEFIVNRICNRRDEFRLKKVL